MYKLIRRISRILTKKAQTLVMKSGKTTEFLDLPAELRLIIFELVRFPKV